MTLSHQGYRMYLDGPQFSAVVCEEINRPVCGVELVASPCWPVVTRQRSGKSTPVPPCDSVDFQQFFRVKNAFLTGVQLPVRVSEEHQYLSGAVAPAGLRGPDREPTVFCMVTNREE